MASSKSKAEDKSLFILRELAHLPKNKECFDCGQKGPTYVNMTIGSFVCTHCSGLLRGLTPPHRVKSISMATFTPEEIEFVKARGNEYCTRVWLGAYNSSKNAVDFRDQDKLKDFMVAKYEKKRYYMDPGSIQSFKPPSTDPPPKATTPTSEVKPLSSLVGSQVKPLAVLSTSQAARVHSLPEISKKPLEFVPSKPVDSFDPFGSLPTQDIPNFANFDNDAFLAASAKSVSSDPRPAKGSAPSMDKYAALADLDEIFKSQKSQHEQNINWNSSSPTPSSGAAKLSSSPQTSSVFPGTQPAAAFGNPPLVATSIGMTGGAFGGFPPQTTTAAAFMPNPMLTSQSFPAFPMANGVPAYSVPSIMPIHGFPVPPSSSSPPVSSTNPFINSARSEPEPSGSTGGVVSPAYMTGGGVMNGVWGGWGGTWPTMVPGQQPQPVMPAQKGMMFQASSPWVPSNPNPFSAAPIRVRMGNAASEDEKEMEQKEGALVHLSPENVLAEDVRKRLTLVQQNHDLPHSRKPGDSPGLLTERSQGDGMERIEASLEEYGYQAENFPLPLMKSPEKLPDSAILLPPAKTAERNRENLLSRKEPKFVPYEPYRGAVKPIIPQPRPHRRRHRKLSGSSVVSLPIGHEKSESPVEWEEERRELEREMEELRKEKQELAHQVAMESQVNTELKKLLVACMGEDFESKLVGLTRDKAQLGDRVQKFTNTLSMELEEKDRLFGQCEVWKSKFLASSLLVDELLRCKAAMGKRLTDAHAALRGLLDEHKEIHGNLIRLSRSLESSGSAQGSVDVRKLNAVELSSVLQGVGVENGIGPSPEQCSLSPAEGIAIRVLSQALPEPELLTAEVLSRQVQGSAQPYLRLGIAPNNDVRYEKLTVNCCDKCDGEIHIM